ncbi:hypothetical protein [Mesorhizobium sp. M0129]|uniref:hypothetical protein n=1 Tax=Mesorhizobium sp. M0129 TaxID=2956886 RepID=UPI003337F444
MVWDQRNWQQGFIFVNLDEAPDVEPGIRGCQEVLAWLVFTSRSGFHDFGIVEGNEEGIQKPALTGGKGLSRPLRSPCQNSSADAGSHHGARQPWLQRHSFSSFQQVLAWVYLLSEQSNNYRKHGPLDRVASYFRDKPVLEGAEAETRLSVAICSDARQILVSRANLEFQLLHLGEIFNGGMKWTH